MKAEKTNHLFQELMFLMAGWDSELKSREVTLRHIDASRKEIELIEDKADKWDEKETPFVPTKIRLDCDYNCDGERYDDVKQGYCECGNYVTEISNSNYCDICGQKLRFDKDGESEV